MIGFEGIRWFFKNMTILEESLRESVQQKNDKRGEFKEIFEKVFKRSSILSAQC